MSVDHVQWAAHQKFVMAAATSYVQQLLQHDCNTTSSDRENSGDPSANTQNTNTPNRKVRPRRRYSGVGAAAAVVDPAYSAVLRAWPVEHVESGWLRKLWRAGLGPNTSKEVVLVLTAEAFYEVMCN